MSTQKQLWLSWLQPLSQPLSDNQSSDNNQFKNSISEKIPILKLPLQFTFPSVEILSKELTKLNSPYKQRIIYLGPRWTDSTIWHKKFTKSKGFSQIDKQLTESDNQQAENSNSQSYNDNQQSFRANEQIQKIKLVNFKGKKQYKNTYFFNQRRVSRTNSYLYDSMQKNKYFKNQTYYRAFEAFRHESYSIIR